MSRAPFAAIAVALAGLVLASCATVPADRGAPVAATQTAAATGGSEANALPADTVVTWSDEAWALFQQEVPKAVQKLAKKEMEKQARQAGNAVIDRAFYDEQKAKRGM